MGKKKKILDVVCLDVSRAAAGRGSLRTGFLAVMSKSACER